MKNPLVIAGLVTASAYFLLKALRGGKDCEECECLEQPPQDFLIRKNYLKTPGGVERANEYRSRMYGSVRKVGGKLECGFDGPCPQSNAVETTFMGLPVTLNSRIIPALKCVEKAIKRECNTCKPSARFPNECNLPWKKYPYQPTRLSGLRYRRTFRGPEISMHNFGIGLDIDPALNSCCGCVGKWKEHKFCKQNLEPYEAMVMPSCWVEQFEKYGFHWLGDDKLVDTMHFEFLGVPPSENIV